jgi:O-antigen/teichoic acid export membrane protein
VLGPGGVGLYVLMLTAAFLGGTVLSMGLPAYNASFASKVPAGVLLANSVAWNGAAAVLLSVVCVPVLAFSAIPITWKVILVGVLMSPLTSLLECTRGVFQGTSAMTPYNWVGVSSGALNLAVIAMLVATSRMTVRTAVAAWIVATVASAAGAVIVAARHSGGLARVDRRVLGGSLNFGGQAWLSQLTGLLNFRIGLLLTEWRLGTVAVGLYAIAVTIAELLFYFPNALAIVSSARYATATTPEARALLRRSALWVLGMSSASAAALAILGGPVITLAFGSSYAESARVLLILLPGVVAFTPTAVATWYFNAHRRKPLVNMAVAGFSATLNGALTLFWARRYGLAGVAWAATTAYALASVLSLILVRREGRS